MNITRGVNLLSQWFYLVAVRQHVRSLQAEEQSFRYVHVAVLFYGFDDAVVDVVSVKVPKSSSHFRNSARKLQQLWQFDTTASIIISRW